MPEKPQRQPRIGYLPTGHKRYWSQFPGLYEKGTMMLKQLEQILSNIGEVFSLGLVDTEEKSLAAAEYFNINKIDIIIVFPVGYCTGMVLVPAVFNANVPIRLINAHRDSSYDYRNADTMTYLEHEGPCCIPEFSGTLLKIGKKFRVSTGCFNDKRLLSELENDCIGAAAAAQFRQIRLGLLGNTYTGMTDMPTDEHRILKVFGKLLVRPEIEEIVNAYQTVTDKQLEEMYAELRATYQVDKTIGNEDMHFSARVTLALDKVIRGHKIDAFGFYWWGESELVTQIRAQAVLAITRLTSAGIPGVTEGDVKTAMAMKILDLLEAGGMFVEFFSIDYLDNFVLMGHDGPGNLNMAYGKPKIINLDVLHGKTGYGLGIDYDMKPGLVTILNLTQFYPGERFKMLYTVAEVVSGDILAIGNPNCRIKLHCPIHEFFEDWCQQGPSHHSAIGYGDRSRQIETFAEAMQFEIRRV